MSIRHMKKEIQGSHYFSFFALSNLLTQTCLHFCRTGLNSNWANAERKRERERCLRWTETEQTRREIEMCVRVLNRNWADAERERCAHAEQKMSRQTERERERERERGVCVHAEQKLSRQTERERERCVRMLRNQDLVLTWQHRRFSEAK